jgi:serine/threonine-protein kinase HipA
VIDQHGRLSIAKFPKETDDYSIELWEEIALQLAERAGIRTPGHELVTVAGKQILLSRRFDREGGARLPYLSALSIMGPRDGDRASYPELVDVLTEHGVNAKQDAVELYRRMVFNVLISNVDDHLRNHGFLWTDNGGWVLSPAFDVNPTPGDVRPRILTTNIDVDEGTCDLSLVESVAGFFGLGIARAREIIAEVGRAVSTWRDVAAAAGARPSEIRRMQSAFTF